MQDTKLFVFWQLTSFIIWELTAHVDKAVFQDEEDEENIKKEAEAAAAADDDNKFQPISFQKKDSERAIMAKRSSYAYLKASREGEEWIDLEVCPHSSSHYNKTPV